MKSQIRRWMFPVFLCLAVGTMFGQQPGLPSPRPQLPDESAPDSKAPHQKKISTREVEEKLRKGFDPKNAAYAGSNIQAAVNDQSVTLTGTVTSEGQREMAVQLAKAYADNRQIVDHLVVQQ